MKHRIPLFGQIVNKKFISNTTGTIVQQAWEGLLQLGVINHAPTIRLDVFQLMPDHVHGI